MSDENGYGYALTLCVGEVVSLVEFPLTSPNTFVLEGEVVTLEDEGIRASLKKMVTYGDAKVKGCTSIHVDNFRAFDNRVRVVATVEDVNRWKALVELVGLTRLSHLFFDCEIDEALASSRRSQDFLVREFEEEVSWLRTQLIRAEIVKDKLSKL